MKKKIVLLALFSILAVAVLYASIQVSRTAQPNYHKSPDMYSNPPEVQHVADNTNVTSNRIQLALILDTSNSMDGLIHQAKSQLWTILNELARAKKDSSDVDISIALYEYGNSRLSVSSGYIRQVLPFTKDLDMISEKLFALRTSGGDEYCGQVIHTSLDQLEWTKGEEALKLIYIAGNEPFNQGSYNYVDACDKALNKKAVVNTIFCGPYREGVSTFWKHGAQITGGQYMCINSDKETIVASTPYDDQIDQLNIQLNQTYIHYGKKGRYYKDNQLRQDANQMQYSKGNKISRVMSKSSKLYSNTTWDLVDAYKEDSTIIATIDRETLPSELQSMNDAELQTHVVDNTTRRDSITSAINKLGAERNKYLATQVDSSNTEGTLGEGIVKTIRDQAKSKGFTFN
jgi:hypothetical protein